MSITLSWDLIGYLQEPTLQMERGRFVIFPAWKPISGTIGLTTWKMEH